MTSDTFGVDSVAHDSSRREILDAAADVFESKGFDRATIDDIADEIGATKGRVYYYFRSKFDIYLAVYENGMRDVRRTVEPYAATPGTGGERLTAMCVAHLVNLMEHLGYHNAIHQGVPGQRFAALKERQRDLLGTLNGLREEYELMFRRVVEEGVADGSLRAEDSRLVTRVLLSSLNSTAMWFHLREGQDPAEVRGLADKIVAQVLVGVVVRG
ncbi:MAG: TetR/AcrR family transcriptional regulator [Corynebacterium sp.]|uniref:TetR/AcrR family transcriptional regulator n=1 Tax=unclassified Corynebacterium TaxID=2624378 RepID=UPI0026471D89|nr:TetR/AcrR family transcriptional regulator [Corynebacterium sp.]MDN5581475.1 TetR/AcrR family transcriptional regulator [Corynebacterium sp.]MDN5719991.1 TetR/AcrR family transcriptional regulator [Corynebacterium sp.]MDN6258174.1 TetR/AcrR family transcriptional regulator [Corynebacterium sp.]MDN6325226.1 TetR/AcrR family transcriptional regulator [Corynebacterium sp.]MDN6386542.1 TetR/AcrR family transcriptional regulator [Corynebacterium sp.]